MNVTAKDLAHLSQEQQLEVVELLEQNEANECKESYCHWFDERNREGYRRPSGEKRTSYCMLR